MLLGLLAERPQHGYELIKESEHVTALAVKAIGNDLLEPQ
jgi:DNA-binding PadR family transcriptional regulator